MFFSQILTKMDLKRTQSDASSCAGSPEKKRKPLPKETELIWRERLFREQEAKGEHWYNSLFGSPMKHLPENVVSPRVEVHKTVVLSSLPNNQ